MHALHPTVTTEVVPIKSRIANTNLSELTELLQPYLSDPDFEWFIAAGFDHRMHLIEFRLAKGEATSNRFVVPCVREVLGHNGVDRLVIAHNHPRGPLVASREDIDATRRVAALCRMAGVLLIDHVIHAPDGWMSMREAGLIH